ncbi:MAG: aldo/keto reductase [Pedobacter sp.]|nr:MAG: aldo/keto reductase [Pedobacter sp.]
MKYRILGKTGLKVSEIGFGAWAIGGNRHGNSYGPVDDEESLRAIQYAYNSGCNFFDTADLYGHGHSEEVLGNFIKNADRDKIIIATKVGCDFYGYSLKLNFSEEYINIAINESFKRLNTDYIDIYQLHNPPLNLIQNGQIFEIMQELKKQGKIRYFGICIDEAHEGIEAIKWGVDTIQAMYNVLEPDIGNELFEYTERYNVGLIAREPLSNGILSGKYTENTYFPFGDIRHAWPMSYLRHRVNSAKVLKRFLRDDIDTLTKLALKFALSNKAVDVVIPGCKNLEQTMENMAISEISDLNEDEIYKMLHLQSRKFDTY